MAHKRNRKANLDKLTCLTIVDHMDYYDFYTKHSSALKFRKHDALQPLDIQSLCSELCAFRYCCTKYAIEKL